MDTEDFVTYEQALALRKLGFRERCYQHYDTSGIIQDNDVINNEVFQRIISSQLLVSHNSGVPKETCDASTLAQAQKWLKRYCNYYIEVTYDDDAYLYRYRIIRYGLKTYYKSESKYRPPEKALSAGITECLKLLNK